MCILLKLHYAKFDVSSLFCSKVIEEKPLGGADPSPLGKGRVNKGRLAKHEIKNMGYPSKHHFITQYISLRGTAVNEFYRMMRMEVAGHVKGNRTETNKQ